MEDSSSEDVYKRQIYPDFPAVQSGGLTCTDFKNEGESFAFMYNQIDKDDTMAQKRFRALYSISSEYLIMSYKRSDVKNGFSKLDIWLSLIHILHRFVHRAKEL